MLNRRILRIKAFKVLYSHAEDPTMSLAEAEAQFEISCEATRSLYLLMLATIPALTKEASWRIEAAGQKFNKTEEERNPNLKFTRNALAPMLEGDPDLQKLLSRRKLGWGENDPVLRKVFTSICSKDYYKAYMASSENSLAEDARLFVRIFEEEFVDSDDLSKLLEDMSVWWNDDLAYSLTCCCDTLKAMAKGSRWELPPLYRSEMLKDRGLESDKSFIYKVLRTAYTCSARYSALVAENTSQWEKDRLFVTDTALILMGLAEAKAFPELPVRVTINEYVEISKYYCTPKSRSFVNGMLDRLVRKLIESGEIIKTGAADTARKEAAGQPDEA